MSDELLKRTPEQAEADRRATEAEVERLKALDAVRGPPMKPLAVRSVAGNTEALLAGIIARNRAVEERRLVLPCIKPLENGDADLAVDRCEAARAWDGCEWREKYAECPRLRAPDAYDEVVLRLTKGQAELREVECILAAARRKDRVPLQELDSLQLVRAVLRRRRQRVAFENAAEVRFPEGLERPGEAFLTGTEAIVAMCGNQGRGKTIAACYAIARLGGYYTRAPDWTRRGAIDLELAAGAPVLVIDQFGREDWGDSDWARSHLENVLDTRFQRRRVTFIVGNLTWTAFKARMDKQLNESTITDRLGGDGIFVVFGGPSIRGQLRLAALQEEP